MARKPVLLEKKESASLRKLSVEKWRAVMLYVVTAMPHELGIVALDLDSVLLYHEHDWKARRLGIILPLGRLLSEVLHHLDYKVVVLTARARDQHETITRYLRQNGVFVDVVTNIKPPADCYFDDKAFKIPKNWE